MPKIPRKLLLCSALVAALCLTLLLPGCAYVARQARGQFELMAGRVPLEKALATVDFTDEEAAKLRLVPAIKAFGEERVGLSPTKNYDTINPTFDQVIWNVSGCSPHRFESHLYAFPVVGALPYIGFFDREDADAERARLEELGWEVYVRSAGAYSTLGWFKDPLWRSMLQWDREQLSNTVLHELAHATVWIKGDGGFNESWAGFVGDQAARQYLRERQDEDPDSWRLLLDREHDSVQYKAFMQALVTRLQGLYGAGLSREEVLRRKERIFEEAREEYGGLGWRLEGYRRSLDPDRPLDNARLVQFRVYNTKRERFTAALERFDGELPAFVEASRALPALRKAQGKDFDPWAALDALKPEG